MKKWHKTTLGFAILSPVGMMIAPLNVYNAWPLVVDQLTGQNLQNMPREDFLTSLFMSCIIFTVIVALFAKLVNSKLKDQEGQDTNFLYTWSLLSFPLPLLWIIYNSLSPVEGATSLAFVAYLFVSIVLSIFSIKPLMSFYKKIKK